MNVRCLELGALDTNCYVVWDDPLCGIVIDPADEADKILNLIRQEGLHITAVVLTHAHFDHMLAAEAVCAATGAPLYVGAGDEAALSDPIRNLSGLFSSDVPLTVSGGRVLRDGDTLSCEGERLLVMETPGHTPGCICLLGDGVLFAGDTLFFGSIGRLDFPGGDPAAMSRSLERLMTLPPDTIVYSGHGPATTIGREKLSNPYVR